jgi:hypothetical protein
MIIQQIASESSNPDWDHVGSGCDLGDAARDDKKINEEERAAT